MSDGEELAVLQLQYGALSAPGGVQQPRWFQIDLPPSVLEAWSQSTDLEPQRHINKIEAIVLAICLCTWPNLIRGSLWLHFIDIDGALACLVSGSSKNSSLSAVVDYTCCCFYTWAQTRLLAVVRKSPFRMQHRRRFVSKNFATAFANKLDT